MAAKAAAAEKIEFTYEGTNRGGTKVKGEIYAFNDTLAKNELRKQGINPLKVKKKPKPLFGGAAKIKPLDIAIFARQMATMMQAGVPLVQSFEIIGQGSENQSMQKLIFGIKAEVEGGVSLDCHSRGGTGRRRRGGALFRARCSPRRRSRCWNPQRPWDAAT